MAEQHAPGTMTFALDLPAARLLKAAQDVDALDRHGHPMRGRLEKITDVKEGNRVALVVLAVGGNQCSTSQSSV